VKKVGVLALQGDFEAHARALERAGAQAVEARTAADLQDLDGLVIPGGESTTMLKLLNRENMVEPLAQFGHERPIFGTCAGAILMASEVTSPVQQSLHLMDIAVERNAYGRQIDSRERNVLHPGMVGERWTRRNANKNKRQHEYGESDGCQKRVVTFVVASDQNLHKNKRAQDHRQRYVEHRGGRSPFAQSGQHKVSHHAKQRDEEIAADPMGGNQSRAGLSVPNPGGRLQDEPDIDRAYEHKCNA